jgi:hypothetical protein
MAEVINLNANFEGYFKLSFIIVGISSVDANLGVF